RRKKEAGEFPSPASLAPDPRGSGARSLLWAAAHQRADERDADHHRKRDQHHRADGQRDPHENEGEEEEGGDGAEDDSERQQPRPPTGDDGRPAVLLDDKHADAPCLWAVVSTYRRDRE